MPSPKQMTFFSTLKSSLQCTHDDMLKLVHQAHELQRKQDDGIFTADYAQEEIAAVRRKMQKRHDEGENQAHDLIAKRLEELDAADALDPQQLTADAELLKLDLLDQHDIDQMMNRNSSNPTMSRLISRYATLHGLEVAMPSYVVELAEDRNFTKGMYETSRVALKWCGDERRGQSVLDQLFAQVGV